MNTHPEILVSMLKGYRENERAFQWYVKALRKGKLRASKDAEITRAVLRRLIERGGRSGKPGEVIGTPGVIRTPDPLLRRQVLYPAELRAHRICLSHASD